MPPLDSPSLYHDEPSFDRDSVPVDLQEDIDSNVPQEPERELRAVGSWQASLKRDIQDSFYGYSTATASPEDLLIAEEERLEEEESALSHVFKSTVTDGQRTYFSQPVHSKVTHINWASRHGWGDYQSTGVQPMRRPDDPRTLRNKPEERHREALRNVLTG